MGLITNDTHEGGAVFLSVRTSTDAKGRKRAVLAQRCKEDTLGAKQVFKADGSPALTKDGDTCWRLEYDAIEGFITRLEKHDADFGDGKKQSYLHIYIKDGPDRFVLSLDRGDRYWSDFLLRLPLLAPQTLTKFQPYSISDDDGKTNQGISMRQYGKKIERRWNATTGYDGGPPPATFDEDEQEWKWGKRNKWMEDNILDPIAKEYDEPHPLEGQPQPVGDQPEPEQPPPHDEDDLPF